MSAFKEIPWLPHRNDLKDFLDLTKSRNYVQAMTEMDVTKLYEIFNQRKKQGFRNNSLNVYLLWCYGQAVKKHPEVQAIKHKEKLIVFDDVDVAMMIEKDLPNGKKIPFPYIFRSVQNKSFEELSEELMKVKKLDFTEIRQKKKSLIIRWLPKFLRMFILKTLLKNPSNAKEVLGTVGLTSLGMVLSRRKFWPVPLGPYPCTIAAGAVYTVNELSEEKKMLCLTVSVDHDISDGAPVARFGNTLIKLMESGEGIK